MNKKKIMLLAGLTTVTAITIKVARKRKRKNFTSVQIRDKSPEIMNNEEKLYNAENELVITDKDIESEFDAEDLMDNDVDVKSEVLDEPIKSEDDFDIEVAYNDDFDIQDVEDWDSDDFEYAESGASEVPMARDIRIKRKHYTVKPANIVNALLCTLFLGAVSGYAKNISNDNPAYSSSTSSYSTEYTSSAESRNVNLASVSKSEDIASEEETPVNNEVFTEEVIDELGTIGVDTEQMLAFIDTYTNGATLEDTIENLDPEDIDVVIADADADEFPEDIDDSENVSEDVEDFEEEIEFISENTVSTNGEFSYDDVYLLAQLIVNESGNQCREGQIAVAEVVYNRVRSASYPDSVYEVIYQQGQFSNNGAIKRRKPTDEQIKIADDVLNNGLRVMDNPDVLYFRNPMITSGIKASTEKNWGSLPYYTYFGDHAFYLARGSEHFTEPASNDPITSGIIPTLVGVEESTEDVNELQPVVNEDGFNIEIGDDGQEYIVIDVDNFSVSTKESNITTVAKRLANDVDGYYFGGKPNGIGSNNTRKDLDCSGYVSWVLETALNTEISQNDMGTANIVRAFGLTALFPSDLQAGDIGFMYECGSENNHCGIYLGNGEWIHCNSKDDGVVIEQTDMFRVYYGLRG